MTKPEVLQTLTNPLITSRQILALRDEYPNSVAIDLMIFKICLITQTAGILLRLPQEIITTAIILLQRFLTSTRESFTTRDDSEGDDLDFGTESRLIRVSSASIFLAAKQSFYPLSPRSIVNVYALVSSKTASPLSFINSNIKANGEHSPPDPRTYFVSEGTYHNLRSSLFSIEKEILAALAFDTHVALPYTLALTYISALSASTQGLVERTLAHLNTCALSPQLLYLTHQPNELAVAAVYLAAREGGVKLVDDEVPWWEVFDVGREELGFLVLSMASGGQFVEANRHALDTKGS